MHSATTTASDDKTQIELILESDPLVGDTACHIHAIYLYHLAMKLKKGKELSADERSFLTSCAILTATKLVDRDEFDVIVDEKTTRNQIPEELVTKTDMSSNNKRENCVATNKQNVATKTIKFLIDKCKVMDFDSDFKIYTTKQSLINTKIPILPFYVSAKMMVNYAARNQIPLAINLKRVQIESINNETRRRLEGAVTIVYRTDVNNRYFVDRILNVNSSKDSVNKEAVVAIDMVSVRSIQNQASADTLLMENTFDEFVNSFKKQDIVKLILIAAAGHNQYTGSTKIDETDPISSVKLDTDQANTAEELDIKQCSKEEYKSLYRLASSYGFFRPGAQYSVKIDKVINRSTECIPYHVDHVYASTLTRCLAQLDQLMNKQTAQVNRGPI